MASPVTGCPIEIVPRVAFPMFSLNELILLNAEETLGVIYDFLGSYILTSPFAEPAIIICCPPTVSSYKEQKFNKRSIKVGKVQIKISH